MCQPNGLKRTACLTTFANNLYPPSNNFRAGNSMITNKLNTKMFIRLVPNNLFQVAVLQLFADKGIINKYNRKENSYKNQYFCTEQAKLIYDF